MTFAAVVLATAVTLAPGERLLLAELEQVDRTLAASEARIARLDREQQSLNRELAAIDAERAAVQVRLGEALVRYRLRVEALARMPAGARLLVLGGVETLADFLRTKRILRWVAEHDRRLHAAYVEDAGRLAALATSIEARRGRLEALAGERRAERDLVAARHNERVALLRAALADREHTGLERTAARAALVATIEKLEPKGPERVAFAANRGRLPWPAAGPVGARFGERVDLEFGTATTHSGVDIRAPAGAVVQAVAAGRVVYADWLRAFGQVVILDHGADYHSVSAHLATVDVELGAELLAGAPIGTVGDSGSLHGPKLYFEIRRGGIAEDPLVWLRR